MSSVSGSHDVVREKFGVRPSTAEHLRFAVAPRGEFIGPFVDDDVAREIAAGEIDRANAVRRPHVPDAADRGVVRRDVSDVDALHYAPPRYASINFLKMASMQ